MAGDPDRGRLLGARVAPDAAGSGRDRDVRDLDALEPVHHEPRTAPVPLVAVLTISYAMGAYSDGRAAFVAPFVIAAGMTAVVLTFPDSVFTDFIFPTAFALVAWLAGRALRTRTR